MREAAQFIAGQSWAPGGLLPALPARLLAFVRAWRARSSLVRLVDLDDHLLSDIGVSRADVVQALELPFAQDPSLELQRAALRNRPLGWRVHR